MKISHQPVCICRSVLIILLTFLSLYICSLLPLNYFLDPFSINPSKRKEKNSHMSIPSTLPSSKIPSILPDGSRAGDSALREKKTVGG